MNRSLWRLCALARMFRDEMLIAAWIMVCATIGAALAVSFA